MQEKKFGAFSSSVDPSQLAKTVEGVIKALAGFLGFLGVSQVVGDVNTLAEQAGQLVTLGYALFGVAETLFGLLRKVFVALSERFKKE